MKMLVRVLNILVVKPVFYMKLKILVSGIEPESTPYKEAALTIELYEQVKGSIA